MRSNYYDIVSKWKKLFDNLNIVYSMDVKVYGNSSYEYSFHLPTVNNGTYIKVISNRIFEDSNSIEVLKNFSMFNPTIESYIVYDTPALLVAEWYASKGLREETNNIHLVHGGNIFEDKHMSLNNKLTLSDSLDTFDISTKVKSYLDKLFLLTEEQVNNLNLLDSKNDKMIYINVLKSSYIKKYTNIKTMYSILKSIPNYKINACVDELSKLELIELDDDTDRIYIIDKGKGMYTESEILKSID